MKPIDMTTLIIGCGFLGKRIGQKLAERNETVFGTTRSPDSCLPPGITPVVADVLDLDTLAKLPTAENLIYCVGFDRSAGIPMRTVYVDGLANTLRVLKSETKRIVYVSSTGVYGQTDGSWVDEDSPTEPATESGRVCLDAERTASRIAEERGFELVIVRYSGLYGPGRVIGRDALREGKPIVGDPDRYLNLIEIDDAARAAILALDRGTPGRLYLASDDEPMLRRTYYETLHARLPDAPPLRFLAPEPHSPGALRDQSNKRISNRRIKAELGLTLRYPNAIVGSTRDDSSKTGPILA
jgi:nucleoside-diphosphate-sugar epimerase